MKEPKSLRTKLLRKALSYLNEGKYEACEEQLRFGEEVGDFWPNDPSDEKDQFYVDLKKELDEYTAHLTSSQRTSLGSGPFMSKRLLSLVERLKQEHNKRAGSPTSSIADGFKPHAGRDAYDEDVDFLDRHYAGEVLDKLEIIVERGSATRSGTDAS